VLKHILTRNAVKAIGRVIESLFNRAKKRFLGKEVDDKGIRFNVITPQRPAEHREDLSLKGVFDHAAMSEGLAPNKQLYQEVEKGVESYFDAHRELAKARVVHEVQAYLHDAEQGSVKVDPEKVLGKALESAFTKVTQDVEKVVDTETTRGRNISTLDAISKINALSGVKDPVIAFIGPNDAHTCEECKRMFFMPDGVTPRAWLSSELRHVYFKRGDNSPCVAGCHPHCFTGKMRLYSNLGAITFEELAGKGDLTVVVDQRIRNRKFPANHTGKEIPGEVRLDCHGKGSKFNMAPGGVYSTGDRECVRITLKTGHCIEVSKDHEMWVDDDNDGVRVKAIDIKIGDKVPLISGESLFGIDRFPIEAELMGNLLGDGYIDPNTSWAHWNFFGNDIPYGNELLKKACLSEEGQRLAVLHRDTQELVKKGPDNVYRCDRATFNSLILGKYFVEKFDFSKLPRRVPKRIWGGDKETVAGFLRGLYAADGTVNADCAIVLAQNDIELLKEIQILLSCFGISAYVCKHDGSQTKRFVRQDGTVREVQFKECWRLILGGVGNLEIFQREIGFGVPIKNDRVADRIASMVGKKPHGSWRTSLVVSVEGIGVRPTYCITEPMTNTVTVNGIVTGQCRHSLVSILPGYGFDGSGKITYIEPGYSVIKAQRS